MTAAEIIAACDKLVDQTERTMLSTTDPGELEVLRLERGAAVARRESLELAAAAATERQRLEERAKRVERQARQGEARP